MRRNRSLALLLLLLALQFSCLGWHAYRSSPVSDEFGHFYAGLAYWKSGDVQLFNVNPPLIRALGTLPAAQSTLVNEVEVVDFEPPARPEFWMGRRLFLEHSGKFQSTLFRGRVVVSVFALLGTVVCFVWGRELSNELGGLCSALLWAFQPQTLAHGSLITNDVPVAAMMVTSAYLFKGWMEHRTVNRALGFGFVFGISLLCKFTSLLLIPVFVMFFILAAGEIQWKATVLQTGLCMIFCWLIVCIPYRFEGVTKSLGEFEFISTTLSQDGDQTNSMTSNRFRGTVLDKVPGMIPAQYLQGLDRQQLDFNLGLESYALGMNRIGSWWWFYLYSMLVKLPLGTWLAIAVGLCVTAQRFRDCDLSIGIVATSAICILFVISMKEGIGQQVRYVIPAYPFLFVLVANAFKTTGQVPHRWFAWPIALRGLAVVGCLISFAATMRVAPNWLPFFNSAAGGSLAGYRHLYNDATDWGQSRYDLADWLRFHPEKRPAFIVSDTIAADAIARNEQNEISTVTSGSSMIPEGDCWLIVSQTSLSGKSDQDWLWHQSPVDSIHAAYLVYKVEGRDWRKHLNAVPEFWRVPDEQNQQDGFDNLERGE